MFREAMPDVAGSIKRGWQARGGKDAADVVVPDLPIWIECKHGIQPNPRAALKQAMGDAPAGQIPVAFIKDNNCDPFVVLPAADFIDLLKEWRALGGGK